MKNSKLESFFIGTLLGDSYIYHNVFGCKQISKDLIEFKANFIREHLPDAEVTIKEHDSYIDKHGVNHQKFYLLEVKHPKMKELYNYFYPNGKKIYPNEAIMKLDKIGFAMWYADDGTTILVQIGQGCNNGARARRVQICTDNFTPEENQTIKSELESLGYEIKLIDRKRNDQFRIQFNGDI